MNDQLPEPHDPVWQLLGRARPVEVHPHFSRRVVEALRHHEETESHRWTRLRALWTPPARRACLAAAAAALVAIGWWQGHPRAGSVQVGPPLVVVESTDPTDELADQLAAELAMIDEVEELLAPERAQDLVEEDLQQLLF